MERSTMYYLKHKGWTNVQVAEFNGHHRNTVARVLREDVEKAPKARQHISTVSVYDAQIAEWLTQKLPVSRMLELARADTAHPYTGGSTAFYDYVRMLSRVQKQSPRNLALRFEGVPGEFLQIDWGEMRNRLTRPSSSNVSAVRRRVLSANPVSCAPSAGETPCRVIGLMLS